jgi:hypothetical protein
MSAAGASNAKFVTSVNMTGYGSGCTYASVVFHASGDGSGASATVS